MHMHTVFHPAEVMGCYQCCPTQGQNVNGSTPPMGALNNHLLGRGARCQEHCAPWLESTQGIVSGTTHTMFTGLAPRERNTPIATFAATPQNGP